MKGIALSITVLLLIFYCNFVASESVEVEVEVKTKAITSVFVPVNKNSTENYNENKTEPVFDQITKTNKRSHVLDHLFQGDIKLDVFRNSYGGKWPKNFDGLVEIPYTLDFSYGSSDRRLIRSAMQDIAEHTCIRFVPRVFERKYVAIEDGDGCWSYIGRTSTNRQELSLDSNGCLQKHLIIHELLHVVGFTHEHSRSDRNRYVQTVDENIYSNETDNFETYATKNYVVYDYNSLLHFTPYSFSKQLYLPALKAVPNHYPAPSFGYARILSPYDIEEVKYYYNCGAGTYERCGRDYFEQDSGTFSSPNYPLNYPSASHCTWNITVRPSRYGNVYVKLTFTSVDLEMSKFCEKDSIIVHDGKNAGAPVLMKICGKSTDLEFTSSGNNVFVIFSSDPSFTSAGFRVTFRRVFTRSRPSATPAGTNFLDAFECDFDKDLCGMYNDRESAQRWLWHSGSTDSIGTGPDGDQSTFGLGYYIYLEASIALNRDNAIIRSPWFNSGRYCINFNFHMHGDGVGGLRLYAVESNSLSTDGDAEMLYERFGDQGYTWWLVSKLSFRAYQKVQFYFEGFVPHYSSDIALDNFIVKSGYCSN